MLISIRIYDNGFGVGIDRFGRLLISVGLGLSISALHDGGPCSPCLGSLDTVAQLPLIMI